jgi:thiamine-monophosphate kinase
MGARPVSAFLSLGLPRNLTMSTTRRPAWVDRFLHGFLALAETLQTPLTGGDLAESPIVVADIVLVGAVPRGKALLRSGARAGDLLYVTGSLGGAAAGLARLGQLAAAAGVPAKPPYLSKKNRILMAPHLYPQPRIAQGLWLRRQSRATAALDLSDGLSTDLGHLCQESGTLAEIDLAALPVHPAATVSQALHGGEDYELLFTASPAVKMPRTIAGVPVTQVGRMLPSRPGRALVTLLTPDGLQPLEPGGWQHFS